MPNAEAAVAPSALPASGEAPIDIRPRLGPARQTARPPLGAGRAPPAVAAPSHMAAGAASAASAPAPDALPLSPSLTARVPATAGPVVALVSPGFAKRAEAEAMLARMQAHLAQTLPPGRALDHQVFETPQGYRAALWPFASREEAQILNATMIARGWRTRAVDF